MQVGLNHTVGRFKSAGQASVSFWKLAGGGTLANLAASAIQRTSLLLVDFGRRALQSAVSMDSLERGLTAIVGSSQEAQKQLARLKEVAKLPGLGFREAIQGSINLQAAGLRAELAERSLKAFGNALALVGKGKFELEGVITALSQISSKGKLSAEEINQIAERVPQIRLALKDAFGTADTEAIQKMGLSTDEAITRIVSSLEGKLPQATASAQTAIENFTDSADQALSKFAKPFLEPLTQALDGLSPHLEPIGTKIRETFVGIGEYLQGFWAKLPESTRAAFGNMFESVKQLGGGIVQWFVDKFPLIEKTVANILGRIAKFWEKHGEDIKRTVGNLFGIVGDVFEAAMLAINGDWEGAWGKMGSAILKAKEAIISAVKFVVSLVLKTIKDNWVDIYELGKGLGKAIATGVKDGFKEHFASARASIIAEMASLTLGKIGGKPLFGSVTSGTIDIGSALEGVKLKTQKAHADFSRDLGKAAKKTGQEYVQEMAHGIRERIPVFTDAISDLMKAAAAKFSSRERIVGSENMMAEVFQAINDALNDLVGEKTALQQVNELIERALANPETARRMDANTQALLRFVAGLRDARSATRERIVGLPSDMRSEGTETRPRSVIADSLDTSLTRARRVFGPTDEEIAAYNERISGMARYASDVLVDAFRTGFDKGLRGFISSLLDSLTSYLDNVLRQALDQIFEQIFHKAGGGAGNSGGGWLNSILSTAIGAITGMFGGGNASTAISGITGGLSAFGGSRAMGGPVKAGVLYETHGLSNAREWFIPSQDGQIANQRQMQGGVTNVFNIMLPGKAPSNYTEKRSAREAADGIVSFLRMRVA